MASAWRDLKEAAEAIARRAIRRAKANAPLVVRPDLVALRCEGDAAWGGRISMLYVGRAALAVDFAPYVGRSDRVLDVRETPFRGTLVDLVRARRRLRAEMARVDVVVEEIFGLVRDRDFDGDAGPGDGDGDDGPDDAIVHVAAFDAELAVAPTLDAQIRGVRSRAQRRRMRAVRKSTRYAAQIVRGARAYDDFMSRLYAPYVAARFGDGAYARDLTDLRRLYDAHGVVLELRDLGDGAVARDRAPVVGGALLLHDFPSPGVISYHCNGFPPATVASADLLAERTTALELAVLDHAVAARARTIDFGYARAALDDGVHVHKRRIGCTFRVPEVASFFRLRVRPALRPAFFAHHPLLATDGDTFVAHLGFDAGAPPRTVRQWRAVLKSRGLAGVARVVVHRDASVPASDPRLRAFETALAEIAGATPIVVAPVVGAREAC